MSASLPSGTVTFLFTDIEGSTKIALEHRDIWEALQTRHHAILQSAIGTHGGHVFQIIGDAFCAAFHTPGEALDAAIEAQRRLTAEDWGMTPIKVRMGINTGVAWAGANVDGSGGYTGYSTLARTQRVMSTAYGGQILLSLTSADLLLGELPKGVTLRDMKLHRLKGLINPEHLWQVMARGLAQDFPALQTLNSIPNNLPLQLTSFIGREKELAEIKHLVENNRLVTLTGSGGVGKTRHALQVGAEVLDAFADGVWLVELASVSDPGLVVHAVATALGVREDAGRPLLAALQDHLGAKTLLLLLDDCERLLDACAQLADALLHACPNLKVLVSSREALGMAGEVTYRVPSLSLPDPQHLPGVESLSQYDAVRMFIERAVAVKSGFVVSEDNAPALAEICFRLDGIPLAIELAAARVRGLSVEQISKRLDDRFRLLTGGSRTAVPRHQTLRAMIEWSHDLLSDEERLAFRRLAVFIGDWTMEAAEAVCLQPGDTLQVMDVLLRLVDKSLVAVQERAAETRYRMLETIRQFAREQLANSSEESAVSAQHLEFFLGFSERAEAQLHGAEPLVWLDQLGEEYENLRAALEWAREAGSIQPAPRLAKATEQLADVQLLLGVATKAIPLYQAALALRHSMEGSDPMIAARLHGKILRTVASLKWRVDAEQFQPLLQIAAVSRAAVLDALETAIEEPPMADRARLLIALSMDARTVRSPQDWELARRYAQTAVEITEQLNAPVDLSTALGELSDAYYFLGLWRERAQVSQKRMALSHESGFGDAYERAAALLDAGDALMTVGEYTQAISLLNEGEELAAQIRSVELEKWGLDLKMHCFLALDRWDETIDLGGQMRAMQQRYPRERIGASCFAIAAIARVRALRGERELAVAGRQEAHAIMTEVLGPSENWPRLSHY